MRTGYNSSFFLYQPQSSGFGNSFPFYVITWRYARKLWNFVADMVCGRFSGTTNDFAFITFPSSTFLRKLTSPSLSFPLYSNIIVLIPTVSMISGGWPSFENDSAYLLNLHKKSWLEISFLKTADLVILKIFDVLSHPVMHAEIKCYCICLFQVIHGKQKY